MTSSASISVTALPVILIWMYIGRTYRLWCSPACSKSSWAQSRRRPSPSEERPPRRWTGTRWWRSLSVLCSRKASALQCEHMSWWSKEKKYYYVLYSLVQYWWYLSQAIAAMKLIDARTDISPWNPWYSHPLWPNGQYLEKKKQHSILSKYRKLLHTK